MRKESTVKKKMNYLLAEFEDTRSPEIAVQIVELVVSGKFKMTEQISTDQVTFWKSAKVSAPCCRCNVRYQAGDPIFYQAKRGWHIDCASDEEKSNCSHYQTYVKQNPIKVIDTDDDTNGFKERIYM